MKFNINEMMQQAQKLQGEMERVKKEAEQKQVTSDSGGGMVKVTMNGAQKIVSIKIAKEIITTDDTEMLEDLIIAAVNKAVEDSQKMVQEEMGKLSGMFPNIPGMNLGL